MKKTAQASGLSLVLQDTCEQRYQDYYKQLLIRLQQQSELCAFSDDAYEKVRFSDIAYDKQVTAIEALKELCIVKGVGSGYNSFEPQQAVTRAEFVKMLVKILSLTDAGSGLVLQPERYVYS